MEDLEEAPHKRSGQICEFNDQTCECQRSCIRLPIGSLSDSSSKLRLIAEKQFRSMGCSWVWTAVKVCIKTKCFRPPNLRSLIFSECCFPLTGYVPYLVSLDMTCDRKAHHYLHLVSLIFKVAYNRMQAVQVGRVRPDSICGFVLCSQVLR